MPSGTPTTPAFQGQVATSPRGAILTSGANSRPQTPSSASAPMKGPMGGWSFNDGECNAYLMVSNSHKPVLLWGDVDIGSWLHSVRLGQYSSTFSRNDISGSVVFDLDANALKEMGIATVGDRIRITSAIKKLKKQCLDAEAINHSIADQQPFHHTSLLSQHPPHQHLLPSGSRQDSDKEQEAKGPVPSWSQTAYSSHASRASPLPAYGAPTNDSTASSPVLLSAGRGNQTLREIRGMGPSAWNVQQRVREQFVGSQKHFQQVAGVRSTADSRPSTATSGPAAGMGSSASSSMTSSAPPRPSTSDGGRPIGMGSNGPNAAPLTPISESSGVVRHPYTLNNLRSPNHERTLVSPHQPPSIDDVKKKTIKFIGEDGTTKILAVSDCRDAFDVLARVLRKFNKPASSNVYTPTAGQVHGGEEVNENDENDELWGIFATSGEGYTKFLTDNELLAICHAPQPHDPLRARGLILRRIYKGDEASKRPTIKRSKLESFFGVASDKVSSGHASPSDEGLVGHVTTEGKRMNRASTMSILSGLGVHAVRRDTSNTHPSISSGQTQRDSAPRSPSSIVPKKARNFLGQRPPSELISSHLTDYFPSAEKRVLERTARRSIYGRPSTSIRSKRDSTWSFAADPDAPPLPSKEASDGQAPAILIGMGRSDSSQQNPFIEQQAPILPPVRSSVDDWSQSLQTAGSLASGSKRQSARPVSYRRTSGESSRSRQSFATKLRMARGISGSEDRGRPASSIYRGDRSDSASMLTVDEITQEVENRRESASLASSQTGWVVDEDGIPIPIPPSNRNKPSSSFTGSTRPSSGSNIAEGNDQDITARRSGELLLDRATPTDAPGEETDRHFDDPMSHANMSDNTDADDGLDTDEDYNEDDLCDDEDEDEGSGVYRSQGAHREPITWIKGALIGAGSFGNVFLGLNAKNGLLMAVKQVELPSGDSRSDQRKKSMLDALEREIELLKTMQHENIVQYLDSYADGTHLNIFLEYVPGGSVAALLRNYGAFQESLVRNFIKQILTGLNFLHTRDIVHRDIKGANILVDNKSCIKISDFGISKKVESDLYVTTRANRPSLQGSVFWMAPEVVKQTSYTRKADIWSLGCLVVEMISGTHPWANLNQMQALYQIGSLAKPALPDEISPEAVDFLNKTFELDHNKRPSAEELLRHPFITEEYTDPAANSGDTITSAEESHIRDGTVKTRGKGSAPSRKKEIVSSNINEVTANSVGNPSVSTE